MILSRFRASGWANNSSVITNEQFGCWGYYIRVSTELRSAEVITFVRSVIVLDRHVRVTYDIRRENEA